MKQGKHYIQKKANSGKRVSLIIALALLLCVSIGATIAYIVANTGEVKNQFTPGQVSCSVEETKSGSTKTSVKIKNTGNTDAYIRVAVIANKVDADGNITEAYDVSSCLAGDGWTKEGGYYYWGQKVAPGETTGELLKSSLDFAGANVTILADAVQADGVASTAAVGIEGQTPSQIVWGWTPAA